MGVRVSLPFSGVVGVTGLGASTLNRGNDNDTTLARNHVYALTGLDGINVNLPLPGLNEDFSGSVIYVKNLQDDIGGGNTNATMFLANGNNVDGIALNDTVTSTRLETFSFFYVNRDIGWLVRM